MSLVGQLQTVATRIATECKSIRTLVNANAADLSALTTSAKSNLVAAINELDADIASLAGGGGASTLDDLTDVAVTSAATGQVLRYSGSSWVNVGGTTYFDAAGAAAAAQAASQPLDADLTSIAALTTTTYGRALLTLADAAALTAALNAATSSLQGAVVLATTTEVTTGTNTTKAVTPAGVAAAVAALVASAPGTLDTLNELAAALGNDPSFATTIATSLSGKQPLDSDLTAIAALTSAADKVPYSTGTATWAMATLTSYARTLIDDVDAPAARTTIDVYSTTQVGDPTTNFVTTFEAGLV